MIGSEDPEYQVSDEEIFQAQVEMFMYAQQLAEERRADAARRHHHGAAERRGRRRVAVGHGLQPVLPAAVGGRQRDDPQRHLARDERVPREPRPVRAAGRATRRAHRRRHRGDPAVGLAGHVLPPQRHPATSSSAARQIKEGDKISLWYISGNRDEDVFDDPFRFDITRDAEPRTSPSAAAARTSASVPSWPAWRSTCCSRSWPSASTTSRRSARPTACAPTSSAGSSTCRCATTSARGCRSPARRGRRRRWRGPARRGGGPAGRRARRPVTSGVTTRKRVGEVALHPRRRRRSRTGRR